MSDRETFQKRLEAVHDFPGPYVVKVIGMNSENFVLQVAQAATLAMGSGERLTLRTRESKAGRHVSVTLIADVEDAEMVLGLYDLLGTVDGVRFIA